MNENITKAIEFANKAKLLPISYVAGALKVNGFMEFIEERLVVGKVHVEQGEGYTVTIEGNEKVDDEFTIETREEFREKALEFCKYIDLMNFIDPPNVGIDFQISLMLEEQSILSFGALTMISVEDDSVTMKFDEARVVDLEVDFNADDDFEIGFDIGFDGLDELEEEFRFLNE